MRPTDQPVLVNLDPKYPSRGDSRRWIRAPEVERRQAVDGAKLPCDTLWIVNDVREKERHLLAADDRHPGGVELAGAVAQRRDVGP